MSVLDECKFCVLHGLGITEDYDGYIMAASGGKIFSKSVPPDAEIYGAPLNVLGLDAPPTMTPIIITPPGVGRPNIVPSELFTVRHSLHFTLSPPCRG